MNKTIVIIGAGPGLGMAVAKKFGTEGFEAILVARNEEVLKCMKDELGKLNISSDYVVADASDSKCLSQTLEEIKTKYGTPYCVVYNVGITAPDTPCLSAEDLTAHFKADVAGALTTVNCFADAKFADKKGAVIFTGGGLAMYPAVGFIPLSIDKAALRALAYILNGKYKEKGIFIGTVTVCGTINTCPYLSAENIAQMYWDMFVNRDKCEYAYQFPDLAPETLYDGKPVEYGIFENNTANYWGTVYGKITEENVGK